MRIGCAMRSARNAVKPVATAVYERRLETKGQRGATEDTEAAPTDLRDSDH